MADADIFFTCRLLLKNKVQAQGVSTSLMNKNKHGKIISTQTKINKQKYLGFRNVILKYKLNYLLK